MNPVVAHGTLVALSGARASSATSGFSVAGVAFGKRSTQPPFKRQKGSVCTRLRARLMWMREES